MSCHVMVVVGDNGGGGQLSADSASELSYSITDPVAVDLYIFVQWVVQFQPL